MGDFGLEMAIRRVGVKGVGACGGFLLVGPAVRIGIALRIEAGIGQGTAGILHLP